ncbi:MAG: hypothetical protein IJR89_07425 [Clostridia bacterium]|nr:hypothetical protein [Clostridia bacterium]
MRAGFYPLTLPEDLSFVVTDEALRVLSFRASGGLPLPVPANGVFSPPAALKRAFGELIRETAEEDLSLCAEIPFRVVLFRRANKRVRTLCTLRPLAGKTVVIFCFSEGKGEDAAPDAGGLPLFPVRRALSALFPAREACKRKRPCRLAGFASLFFSAFADAARAEGRTLSSFSSLPADRYAELFGEAFAAASAALFSLFLLLTRGDIRAEMKETKEGLFLSLSAESDRLLSPFSADGPLYPAHAALGGGEAELLTVDDIAEKSGFFSHLSVSEEGTVSASLLAASYDVGELGFKAATEYDNTEAVFLSARRLWLSPVPKKQTRSSR